jgi:hypothetical protein
MVCGMACGMACGKATERGMASEIAKVNLTVSFSSGPNPRRKLDNLSRTCVVSWRSNPPSRQPPVSRGQGADEVQRN